MTARVGVALLSLVAVVALGAESGGVPLTLPLVLSTPLTRSAATAGTANVHLHILDVLSLLHLANLDVAEKVGNVALLTWLPKTLNEVLVALVLKIDLVLDGAVLAVLVAAKVATLLVVGAVHEVEKLLVACNIVGKGTLVALLATILEEKLTEAHILGGNVGDTVSRALDGDAIGKPTTLRKRRLGRTGGLGGSVHGGDRKSSRHCGSCLGCFFNPISFFHLSIRTLIRPHFPFLNLSLKLCSFTDTTSFQPMSQHHSLDLLLRK